MNERIPFYDAELVARITRTGQDVVRSLAEQLCSIQPMGPEVGEAMTRLMQPPPHGDLYGCRCPVAASVEEFGYEFVLRHDNKANDDPRAVIQWAVENLRHPFIYATRPNDLGGRLLLTMLIDWVWRFRDPADATLFEYRWR